MSLEGVCDYAVWRATWRKGGCLMAASFTPLIFGESRPFTRVLSANGLRAGRIAGHSVAWIRVDVRSLDGQAPTSRRMLGREGQLLVGRRLALGRVSASANWPDCAWTTRRRRRRRFGVRRGSPLCLRAILLAGRHPRTLSDPVAIGPELSFKSGALRRTPRCLRHVGLGDMSGHIGAQSRALPMLGRPTGCVRGGAWSPAGKAAAG